MTDDDVHARDMSLSETEDVIPKSHRKKIQSMFPALLVPPASIESGNASASKPKSSEKQQLTSKPVVSETGVSKPKSSEKLQSTWSKCCNQLAAHNNLQGTCLVAQVDSALHPFWGAKSSTGFGWG